MVKYAARTASLTCQRKRRVRIDLASRSPFGCEPESAEFEPTSPSHEQHPELAAGEQPAAASFRGFPEVPTGLNDTRRADGLACSPFAPKVSVTERISGGNRVDAL